MNEAEPATVLDAVRLLEAEGFGGTGADGVHCGECGTNHSAGAAEVVRVYRFEGPSDPEEEAVVYALQCPQCGRRGTLVSAFGPTADPEITDHLVMLEERFRTAD